MAKGDVLLKFDAETAAYLQKIRSATDAYAEQTNKTRALGDAHEKAGHQAEKFGEKVVDSAKDMVSAFGVPLSIIGAIELAFKTMENTFDRLREKGREEESRQNRLAGALASTGQSGQLTSVKAMLEEIANDTAKNPREFGNTSTNADVEGVYAKIHLAGAGRTSIKSNRAGTIAALKGMGGNMTPEDASALGAATAKVKELVPGMSDEDAGSLALYLQTNAPDVLNEPRTLAQVAKAKDRVGVMKFAAAGYKDFQGSRQIKPIMEYADQHGLTLEQILADPNRLPTKERATMRAIIEGEGKLVDPGSLNDLAAKAIAGEGPSGQLVRMGRETAAINRRTKEEGGVLQLTKKEISDRIEARVKELTPIAGDIPGVTGMFGAGGGAALNIFSRGGMSSGRGTDEIVIQLMEEQNAIARQNAEHMILLRQAVGENRHLHSNKDGAY